MVPGSTDQSLSLNRNYGAYSMKRLFCILLLPLVSLGCGRSDLPDLGTVSGVVTLDGQPLPNAVVNFTPTGEGRPSTAETDEEGRYSLIYLQGVDGAIVGEHVVSVELIMSDEMDDLPDDPSEMTEEQKAMPRLPESAADSSIRKEVKSGDNEINIAL
jgi:hypothetical protein